MITKNITQTLFAVCLLCCNIVAALTLSACSDDEDNGGIPASAFNANRNDTSAEPALSRLEFPRAKGGRSIVIIHTTNDPYGISFSTEWDCDRKSQRWSCFQMHNGNSSGSVGRYREGYPFDEDMPDHSRNYVTNEFGVNYDPFWNSGYDHGHICASADRQYSSAANRQTFFLTNMQPQYNRFNSNLWADMEQQVRWWNRNGFRDTLFVCKGGTIDSDNNIIEYISNQHSSHKRLNDSYIPVPRYFFIALLCKNQNGYKALGFWVEQLNQNRSGDALSQYVVNIDELEALTGIDFFCNLPDELEKQVESASHEEIIRSWGL